MEKRLVIKHNDTLFATKEAALNYLNSQIIYGEGKIALVAEPIVLKYGTDVKNPNIILAIGSYGNGVTSDIDNKYFIIDTATLEADIANLKVEIEDLNIDAINQAISNLMDADIALNQKLSELQSALEAEVTRATEVEQSLKLYTENTSSINLNHAQTITGTTISADLKISTTTGNQLEVLDPNIGGGLYYSVDMAYRTGPSSGLLDLKVNGNVVRTIDLPLERFLQSASYDVGNKELVFVFVTEGGPTETVRIPVADLVDEYNAGLGLTLINNVFSVNVNTLASEPFLVVDANGIAIQGVQNAINSAVTTERNRAIEAEQTERDARIAGDNTLQTNINNESTARVSGDNTLQSNINAEVTRASNAEEDIRDTLTEQEHTIELLEQSLTSSINNEITRAKGEEARIESKLDSNVNSINNSISALQTSQNEIASGLTAEIDRAKAAEAEIKDNLSTLTNSVNTNTGRIATMRTDVNNLISGLSTETQNRIADDGILRDNLNNEIVRATGEEGRLAALITANTSNISTVKTDLATEISRAVAGEAAAESNAKTYADGQIATAKATLTNDIATSLTQAKDYADSKDVVLSTEITRVDNKAILATSSEPTALVMTSSRAVNGDVTINADLELSTTGKNTIVIKSDGLSAEFDLEYTNGILNLISPNHGVVASTSIAIGGLIQDISYNASTYEFTMTFKLEDGSTKTETIDMSGLVRTWVIDNTVVGGDGRHTALSLFLAAPTSETQGKERLYGDVNISPNNVYGSPDYLPTNNLLAKHTDASTQNGYLFVDGLAKFIKFNNNENLEDSFTTIKNDVTTIKTTVATHETNITTLQGEIITSGTYTTSTDSMTLNKANGNTVTVTGFTVGLDNKVDEAPINGEIFGRKNAEWVPITDALTGNLEGITSSVVNNIVTLSDTAGRTVSFDLTPIVNTAVTQALTQIFKPSRFLEAVSDETEVNVVVDEIAQTVTFGFGESATLNAGAF